MMGGAQMCMHSMRKPAISSYLKWCQVRVNKMETWALLRYYMVIILSTIIDVTETDGLQYCFYIHNLVPLVSQILLLLVVA